MTVGAAQTDLFDGTLEAGAWSERERAGSPQIFRDAVETENTRTATQLEADRAPIATHVAEIAYAECTPEIRNTLALDAHVQLDNGRTEMRIPAPLDRLIETRLIRGRGVDR